MGLFGFGNKKETTAFPWNQLTSIEQLKEIIANSANKPALLFKHSTRCSISSMAKSRLEREWNLELPIYYLDLIQYRPISSLIAIKSGVEHQSPQLIVFQNGKPIYDASHSGIDIDEIKIILKID